MIKLLWLMAASLLLAGCDLLNPSTLAIENVGNSVAENVVVFTSDGEQWVLGDLPSGETVWFRQSLEGEGGINVAFGIGGQRLVWHGCYYTSGGLMPAVGKLAINGREMSGSCS